MGTHNAQQHMSSKDRRKFMSSKIADVRKTRQDSQSVASTSVDRKRNRTDDDRQSYDTFMKKARLEAYQLGVQGMKGKSKRDQMNLIYEMQGGTVIIHLSSHF